MNDINDLFAQRILNIPGLNAYGFQHDKQGYCYSRAVFNDQFVMTVKISIQGKVSSTVVDKSTGEDYILHRISSATGAFVGNLREEYEQVLREIAETCFTLDIFKTEQAKAVIQFINHKYHHAPEFLWPRFPGNAIFRRSDNDKWYAAILSVESDKLGGQDKEKIEIIDVKMDPADILARVDGKTYFPGYHMNKKHWVTLRLDGSVPLAEIIIRIENSFQLAEK